ncbi:MAG: hypothetical protein K2F83_01790 [Oscillospiraceae bacterium]|nr:hypothetical protein [Oscillospiraceae bacterium]
MDKSLKKNRAAKAKAEEEALNSILCWVVGGLTLEFLLVLLNRYWVYYRISEFDFRVGILEPVVKVLAFLALVGTAAAAFWWKKGGMKERLPLTAALLSLGISAGCFSAWLVGEAGITVMYTVVPAIILLAVIYHLYQREFFLISCLSAVGLLGIWLCSHGVSGRTGVVCWIYVLGALAAVGVVTWGFFLCQKEQGNLTWEGKKLRLLAKDTFYPLLYTAAAITAGVLVCALMGVPTMVLYAISVAWLLIMAVYYSVKLM